MPHIDTSTTDDLLTILYAYQEELELTDCGDYVDPACEARGCGSRCGLESMKRRVARSINVVENCEED